MSKEIKYIPKVKKDSETHMLKQSLSALKQSLAAYPILAFLEGFDSFLKKKKKILANKEILFSPGENPYFYIISSWALSIIQITPNGEKKEVGVAYAGSFIGEGIFFDRNQKDIEALSIEDGTTVIALMKADIAYLESQAPEKIISIYKHIIEVTNGRLLESGKELASLYEMNAKIDELSSLGEQGFKNIINHITKTIDVDYIISVEQHPAIPGLFVYKYNSRFPSVWPINQKVAKEIPENISKGKITSTGEILGTHENDSLYILPLKTHETLKGYFILGKKNKGTFQDSNIRIIDNIAPLLASIIENNQTLADKKAMGYK